MMTQPVDQIREWFPNYDTLSAEQQARFADIWTAVENADRDTREAVLNAALLYLVDPDHALQAVATEVTKRHLAYQAAAHAAQQLTQLATQDGTNPDTIAENLGVTTQTITNWLGETKPKKKRTRAAKSENP